MDALRLCKADGTAASRVRTAAEDYDPAALDAQADRLNRASACALAGGRPDTQRLVVEACAAAAQLRRLAADVRVLEGFLAGCGLLAEAEETARTRSG